MRWDHIAGRTARAPGAPARVHGAVWNAGPAPVRTCSRASRLARPAGARHRRRRSAGPLLARRRCPCDGAGRGGAGRGGAGRGGTWQQGRAPPPAGGTTLQDARPARIAERRAPAWPHRPMRLTCCPGPNALPGLLFTFVDTGRYEGGCARSVMRPSMKARRITSDPALAHFIIWARACVVWCGATRHWRHAAGAWDNRRLCFRFLPGERARQWERRPAGPCPQTPPLPTLGCVGKTVHTRRAPPGGAGVSVKQGGGGAAM